MAGHPNGAVSHPIWAMRVAEATPKGQLGVGNATLMAPRGGSATPYGRTQKNQIWVWP